MSKPKSLSSIAKSRATEPEAEKPRVEGPSRRRAVKRWTPEEEKAFQEDWNRRREKVLRIPIGLFQFWQHCTAKECKRARGCVGDVPACFERWWPHVPEHMKVWLRTAMKAQAAGKSGEEVRRAANEAEAGYVKQQEDIAALLTAPRAIPREAPVADPPAPRVRRL